MHGKELISCIILIIKACISPLPSVNFIESIVGWFEICLLAFSVLICLLHISSISHLHSDSQFHPSIFAFHSVSFCFSAANSMMVFIHKIQDGYLVFMKYSFIKTQLLNMLYTSGIHSQYVITLKLTKHKYNKGEFQSILNAYKIHLQVSTACIQVSKHSCNKVKNIHVQTLRNASEYVLNFFMVCIPS